MTQVQNSPATAPAPAAPSAPAIASPNVYHLSGGGIHVAYMPTGAGGLAHFSYQDAHLSKNFSGNEIRKVDVPDLGTIVSVTLLLTVDSGSTTFSVLIPQVNLPNQLGASAPIHTDGITTVHRFSLFPPLDMGQRELYTVTPLSGTGSLQIIPL